jgi:hypothetical protein
MEASSQLHTPAALPLGKQPLNTHWTGDWVGPRANLDILEKRKIFPLPGIEHRLSSPLLHELRHPTSNDES